MQHMKNRPDPNCEPRLRFAPSPTGEIHIGNLRTLIFNWIFAKKYGGKLFLRIEDTHEERCTKEYKDLILEMTQWLKLDYDDCFQDEIINHKFDFKGETYIKQSDYEHVYVNYALKLFNEQKAYYCICEKIELRCKDCRNANHDQGVLRFKVPEDYNITYDDLVFGNQRFNSSNIEDFALLRSNKKPTYMLCVVVDDHNMAISHVIRGEDHKTNTFKQILIYESLSWYIPFFAHLPIVKDDQGKKMSKRNKDSNSVVYKQEGVVPEAFFNILFKLGWGYKNEEIISKQRLLEIFEVNQIRKSPTMFDKKKLYNFSGAYLRDNDYRKEFILFIKENKHIDITEEQVYIINELYDDLATRACTFDEMYKYIDFLFHWEYTDINMNPDLILKLESIEWNYETLKELLSKDILASIRKAVTNSEHSINILKILYYLGKKESLRRLR